jgi:hypothetical protein
LKKAAYIGVKKTMKKKYPLTACRVTAKGAEAFESYVEAFRNGL